MCCGTHTARDQLDIQARITQITNGKPLAWDFAEDERLRCQCDFSSGHPCKRRMTGEDLLCDWCRVTDHLDWCRRHAGTAGGFGPPDRPMGLPADIKKAFRRQAEAYRAGEWS